jgi:hypothetical protein
MAIDLWKEFPTVARERAIESGDVESIQRAHVAHCVETGCEVGVFGGHVAGCYCFTFQLAVADAREVREATS